MAGPNVRVHDELKAEAVAYAAPLGISLNALVAVALREYLDRRKAPPAAPEPSAAPVPPPSPPKPTARPSTARAHPTSEKVGPNDPCPCGSGQKAKRCHPEACGR